MNRRRILVTLGLLLLGVTTVIAQTSASYRLDEAVFNSGGHPSQGTVLASTSYQIRLDSLGEGLVGPPMTGPSYNINSGFGSAYLPPGEVRGLRFESTDILAWDPERSAGTYNLYRDLISAAGGYGACHQQGVSGASATDTDVTATGEGYFYLVTVENRIQEEGAKGSDSAGSARGGTVCP
ncbi:MAG: hypothetical protein IFK94_10765 [Acidobacteria bacterium]|uniref:Uncharacterized protein n=1 Tax=Candidatus Polarisedimenticola svalbardensis TaxID=2886004 RepID=A0A8J7CES3_9BACT|nr:hypothetical protein [Candidatus Polarisedimenticola svalbardensis]